MEPRLNLPAPAAKVVIVIRQRIKVFVPMRLIAFPPSKLGGCTL